MLKFRHKHWIYPSLSLVLFAVLFAVGFAGSFAHLPEGIRAYLDGFGGSLISSGIVALSFFLLALFFDKLLENKVDRIQQVSANSEQILYERERLLEVERNILRFEQFLKKESYHEVRFPDITTAHERLGLLYRIEPVRDSETGDPRVYRTEMREFYVIKVRGPAYYELMSCDRQAEYADSPIRSNEYYFCAFGDDSWRMGTEASYLPYRFYLSGKVGPVESVISANQFMARFQDPIGKRKKVAEFLLQSDGKRMSRMPGSSGSIHEIYTDEKGELFLRIHDSQLKRIYYKIGVLSGRSEKQTLEIDDILGFAHGKQLDNIKRIILEELKLLGLEPQKEYVDT
jgi:hypothetical protein